MRVALGYPNENDERAILRRFRATNPLDELVPVVGADEILALQKIARQVFVHSRRRGIHRARDARDARRQGDSTRRESARSLALYHTAQALAAMHGREYVLPDDVKRLIQPALEHRIIATSQSRVRGRVVSES